MARFAALVAWLLGPFGHHPAERHKERVRPSAQRMVHTLTAFITGYDQTGLTATGTLAGPGTCAVDAAYIPLHAHIRIAGVGGCLALDTGGLVRGYHIDVWEPTLADCYRITGYRRVYWWD